MNDDIEPRVRELLAERARVSPETVERVARSIERLPDRRVRARTTIPLAAVAAVLIVAVVGIAVATLVRRPADVVAPASPLASATDSPTMTASPTVAAASPTIQPRPVWAMSVADHLDCDGPPSTMGMDVPARPGPFDPGQTPDDALQNILSTYRSLPRTGYTAALVTGDWALHRYLLDGEAKVHIVSTNRFPDVPEETRWEVVGLRACDPSEFALDDLEPGALTDWRDAGGRRLRTDVINSLAGPAHCGWQRTVFLSLGPDRAQYIRDPRHELEDETVMSFDPDVALPDDATDTGFHTDRWHMFTIPSGRAVYMRTADGAYERWPRAREPIGCA
jgi:hypothetical protein